jgi:DNA-binding CsgD family transcriptional regulator
VRSLDVRADEEGNVVRCGAELVALSEVLYLRSFAGGIVVVGLAALAALALLPLRQSAAPVHPLTPTVVAAALLVVAAPVAACRPRRLYGALRRRRGAQLAVVALAAALVAYPLRSELWWPSCALLMLLATVVPLGRALGYCLLVLAVNLGAHLLAGDLGETPPVAIVGLWIGDVFWVTTAAVFSDRIAAYVLHLNAIHARRRPAPRRVSSWAPREPQQDRATAPAPPALPASRPPDETDGTLRRLTARQLQVVALLADGLRYDEVAACLSISVRQVERHVAVAVARLGLRNANELVTVAVAHGIVPR